MAKRSDGTTCQIKGCGYPAVYATHRLCAAHYQRYRLGQNMTKPIRRSRSLAPFKEGA